MPIDEITQAVSDRYAKAAGTGEQMCCPTSHDMGHLKTFVPEEVLNISYGCGTPAGLNRVRAGEMVLDIGSGGGIDCFEAARLVGPFGHIIGIDMTDMMLEIARKHAPIVATNLGYARPNVEFRLVEGLRDGKQVCYRIAPTVQRALANGQGHALDFGCCEVRFPETVLVAMNYAR